MSILYAPTVEEEEPPGGSVAPNGRLNVVEDGLRMVRRRRISRSSRHSLFRSIHFPDITQSQWNDWRWQLGNRFRTRAALERVLTLSDAERSVFARSGPILPVAITPYYLSLLDPEDSTDPLRRTMIPTIDELRTTPGEEADPLHEDGDSPVPGIVHRYPDRVLFLLTESCAAYCRYCTRSRRVGDHPVPGFELTYETNHGMAGIGRDVDISVAIEYIRRHPEIRDVLLSGGDPLTMPDDFLERILSEIRAIPHVEIIRIGTKVPAVLPMRITPALVKMLRKYHPLFISIHATHPSELTPAMVGACTRLADAGIPLGSQTVLLQGINDSVETMKELMHRLLMARVRPYYLYQCDPIRGSAHFRTPVQTGLDIIRGLRGYTSGYAIPSFVIDAPGGGGKIPLLPEYLVGRDGKDIVLKNYEGGTYRYPDTGNGTLR